MPQYVCPNCKTKLSLPEAVPPGTEIGCGVCGTEFAAPAAKAGAKAKAGAPAQPAAAAIPFKTEPPPEKPAVPMMEEEEEEVKYGVKEESEEEKKLAEVNKPKFSNIKDKFVKSARGPAPSLLVMPSNLMLAEGGVTIIAGIFFNVIGLWPLLFSGGMSPSDEELSEMLFNIFLGVFLCLWGGIICFAVAQMQSLGSYSWAVAGSCIAILPLLAGIFGLIVLFDKRVIEGFKEPESGPSKAEKKDEDDEEEEEKPKKKRKK